METKTPDKPTPQRTKRTFTLVEAERALVLVRRIVADVVGEYARVLDLQEILEVAEDAVPDEEYETLRADLARSAGRLRQFVTELNDVGVELKDWSLGVVDFPCLAGGRRVCLSWQHGDGRIGHWHEVDTGLAGLQPISTLPANGRYATAAARPGPRSFRRRAGSRLPQK